MLFSTSRSRSFVLIALMAVLLMVALMTCYSTSASAAMSMLRRHGSAGSTPKYGRPSAVHVKHTPELSEHGAVAAAAAAAATAAAAPAAVPSTAPITSSLRDNGKNTAHHPAHPRAFNPQDSSSVYIWPLPKQVTSGSVQRTLAHPLTVELNTDSDDVMNAVDRYTSIIFPHSTAVTPVGSLLTTLVINVNNLTDVSPPLQLGVNETYTLYVPSDANSTTMYISANNFFGVLRALETFSQVVQWDAATMTYFIANAPWSIVDEPRFAHRGVLLDTSRHFEPIASIMEFLDALSYAKLNLFHWHLSDHQSFPYHSQSLPRLSMGAYSLADRYTLQDVADVVEYARQRGIRVMLEFDVPGHASSWCAGYPDVCPSTTCLTPLDPSTENVFKLMTTLFNDFTNSTRGSGVVYDDFFHLGGDEVDTSCWTETPRIAQWLAQQNYTADQAYMYVVERAQKIIQAQGRDPVNWEEVYNHFGTKLPRSTVVHIWLDKSTLAKATADGFRAILSDQDFWYLDHLDTTWQQFYLNEPLSGITDPAQQKLVLGGEACMWGETVDTSDMLQTIWPRGAAFAERMWSPASVNDTDAALPRLQWYRCLLNDRGVQAAPTLNPEARSAPSGPGACLSQ